MNETILSMEEWAYIVERTRANFRQYIHFALLTVGDEE